MSSTEQGQSPSGEVSAEDADSLAAQFRPAWELDEAPFAAGGDVAPEAIDALAQTANGNAGVAAPAAFTAPQVIAAPAPAPAAPATSAAVPPHAPANGGMHAKTMMGMAAPQMPQVQAPAPGAPGAPLPGPVGFSATQPGPADEERQLIRSERPPAIGVGVSASRGPARPAVVRPIVDAQNANNSDQYAIPRKSSLPMIIGIGAVLVALAGVGIAVKFAFGDAPPKDLTAAGAAGVGTGQARPKNDIPPPPKDDPGAPLSQDIPVMKPGSLPKAGDPAGDQPTAQAAQPAQPAQPAQAAQPKPQPMAAVPVPAPPRPNANSGPVTAPVPQPPKAPKAPKGSGGIVRDSPF